MARRLAVEMRPGTRGSGRLVLLVISAVAVAGILGESGSSAPTTATANAQTYLDATGDNLGGSPDITTVAVSNDDEGDLEFRIRFANRTDFGNADFIAVYLDTDRGVATGCDLGAGFGADWNLNVRGRNAPEADQFSLVRYTGCTPGPTPQETYLVTFDAATSTLILRVNRSELGNTTGFRFLLVANIDPVSVVTWDLAGDSNPWLYEIVITPPRDTTAPKVKALSSSGVKGRVAKLRYTVFEESGRAREVIQIFRGKKVIATKRVRMGRRTTRIYSTPWRVPKTAAGRHKFCVRAWDAAGNRSKQSCAAIRLR